MICKVLNLSQPVSLPDFWTIKSSIPRSQPQHAHLHHPGIPNEATVYRTPARGFLMDLFFRSSEFWEKEDAFKMFNQWFFNLTWGSEEAINCMIFMDYKMIEKWLNTRAGDLQFEPPLMWNHNDLLGLNTALTTFKFSSPKMQTNLFINHGFR